MENGRGVEKWEDGWGQPSPQSGEKIKGYGFWNPRLRDGEKGFGWDGLWKLLAVRCRECICTTNDS
jgi:hypothetical protein